MNNDLAIAIAIFTKRFWYVPVGSSHPVIINQNAPISPNVAAIIEGLTTAK